MITDRPVYVQFVQLVQFVQFVQLVQLLLREHLLGGFALFI